MRSADVGVRELRPRIPVPFLFIQATAGCTD